MQMSSCSFCRLIMLICILCLDLEYSTLQGHFKWHPFQSFLECTHWVLCSQMLCVVLTIVPLASPLRQACDGHLLLGPSYPGVLLPHPKPCIQQVLKQLTAGWTNSLWPGGRPAVMPPALFLINHMGLCSAKWETRADRSGFNQIATPSWKDLVLTVVDYQVTKDIPSQKRFTGDGGKGAKAVPPLELAGWGSRGSEHFFKNYFIYLSFFLPPSPPSLSLF